MHIGGLYTGYLKVKPCVEKRMSRPATSAKRLHPQTSCGLRARRESSTSRVFVATAWTRPDTVRELLIAVLILLPRATICNTNFLIHDLVEVIRPCAVLELPVPAVWVTGSYERDLLSAAPGHRDLTRNEHRAILQVISIRLWKGCSHIHTTAHRCQQRTKGGQGVITEVPCHVHLRRLSN